MNQWPDFMTAHDKVRSGQSIVCGIVRSGFNGGGHVDGIVGGDDDSAGNHEVYRRIQSL